MPIFNLTIPDYSPLINYTGFWNDSKPFPSTQYVDGAYHTTNDSAAAAELDFYGSGVYAFGLGRPEYGEYNVSLDGLVTGGNAHLDGPLAGITLFAAPALNNSRHRFVLQNHPDPDHLPATSIDIDYIVVTTGDGDTGTSSFDESWDDGHSDITYSDGWETSPNGLEHLYYNGTMHRTQRNGASASMTFTGNAVQVYGAVSGNHGPFSVALDQDETQVLNGSRHFHPQTLLFYAGGLSDGAHNLTLSSLSDVYWFDIDKIVVSSWRLNSSSTTTTTAVLSPEPSSPLRTVPTTPSRHTSQSHAVIIACSVTGAVAAAVLLGLALVLRARRRRRLLPVVSPMPFEAMPATPENLYGPHASKLREANNTGSVQVHEGAPQITPPSVPNVISQTQFEPPPSYSTVGVAL